MIKTIDINYLLFYCVFVFKIKLFFFNFSLLIKKLRIKRMFQLLTICSLLFVCCITIVNSQEKCESYTFNGNVYEEKICGVYCCGFCDYRYCCEYSEYRLENQASCKPPENCSSYYGSNGSVQKENDCGDLFCCGSCKTRYCCNAAKNRLNQSKCSNDETTKKTTNTTLLDHNNNDLPL